LGKVFSSLAAQFADFYKNLTPTKKASLVTASALVVMAGVIVSVMLTGQDYKPLFRNVAQDQLPLIVGQLQKRNVPFRLRDNGNTIVVPSGLLHATQMSLMAEIGSKDLGSVGLELFDKQDFGTTSYAQRINFQRALQGELTRSINTLTAVKKAKVILALPEKKTFLEESGQSSASVVVDLYAGKILTPEQVRGITYLVSSAVEGLDPDSVTVIDSAGKMLTQHYGDEISATSRLMEIKEKAEKEIERKVETILGRVVGGGKVVARATVLLNPNKTSTVEESYDQDKTAIRQITTEEEALNGARTNPAGIPGARANLPGAQGQGQVGFNQNVKKETKKTNFEVPKIVKQIVKGAGTVEKISVAVLVDGVLAMETGKDGKVTEVWKAREPAELLRYEEVVKNTIGFSGARGDTVKIENFRFSKEEFEESERLVTNLERRKLLEFILYWTFLGSVLLLFFFTVVRPFMRWITDSFQDSVDDILPKTIEELEELQTADHTLPGMTSALPILEESIDPDKAESELLRERIMNYVERDAEKSAGAFSLWLSRRDT